LTTFTVVLHVNRNLVAITLEGKRLALITTGARATHLFIKHIPLRIIIERATIIWKYGQFSILSTNLDTITAISSERSIVFGIRWICLQAIWIFIVSVVIEDTVFLSFTICACSNTTIGHSICIFALRRLNFSVTSVKNKVFEYGWEFEYLRALVIGEELDVGNHAAICIFCFINELLRIVLFFVIYVDLIIEGFDFPRLARFFICSRGRRNEEFGIAVRTNFGTFAILSHI
jgi:hypothetical protein